MNWLFTWPRLVRTKQAGFSSYLMTLLFGVGLLLIWAGLVEGFFSQYHEPVLPYAVKIMFGVVELGLLIAFFTTSGSTKATPALREPV